MVISFELLGREVVKAQCSYLWNQTKNYCNKKIVYLQKYLFL